MALSILLVPGAVRRVDRANLLRLLAGAVPGSLVGGLFAGFLGQPAYGDSPGRSRHWGRLVLLAKYALSRGRCPADGGWRRDLREECWEACSEPAVRPMWPSSQARPWTRSAFRATLIVLFAVEYAWRLGLYAHQGLLDISGVCSWL